MTKEQRSYIMSRIKSKNTGPERRIQSWLANHGINGFTRNDRRYTHTPDFLFEKEKIALFYNSRFWHNRDIFKILRMKQYWRNKFIWGWVADIKAYITLRLEGFKVIVLWDEDLDNLNASMTKVSRFVKIRRNRRGG